MICNNERLNTREQQFQVTFNKNLVNKKSSKGAVQLRRDKRMENLSKKRGMPTTAIYENPDSFQISPGSLHKDLYLVDTGLFSTHLSAESRLGLLISIINSHTDPNVLF